MGRGCPRRGDTRCVEELEQAGPPCDPLSVLISQFEPDQILSVETSAGRSRVVRLSEIPDVQDLLERYALGTLYMSELVAGQSRPDPVPPPAAGAAG